MTEALPDRRHVVTSVVGHPAVVDPVLARGYRAVVLSDGVTEWRAQGLPVDTGDAA